MAKHFLILLLVTLVIIGCSQNNNLVGNDVETGNPTISGTMVDSTGKALEQVEVRLVPENYNIVLDSGTTIFKDTTDSLGQYNFSNLDEGGYNVEGVLIGGNSMSVVKNVIYNGENIELENDTMETLKNMVIRLPEGSNSFNGYLYVPGTSIGQEINLSEGDSIQVSVLPSTELENILVVDTASNSETSIEELVKSKDINIQTIEDLFTDVSGEFEFQPYFDWSQSKSFRVMTGDSGIKLTENLYNFPILLRLTTDNFHFSVANPDLSDLRITKPNGKALPIQVDHFDNGFEMGAVWVLVDTLYAGREYQTFHMYYGNSNVTFLEQDVFKTEDAWAGVWHLEESKADTSGETIYKNSVTNGEGGADYILSDNKQGVIGKGQGFGIKDFMAVKNAGSQFKPTKTVTISAWIKIDSVNMGGATIATMGNNYNFRVSPNGKIRFSIYNNDTIQAVAIDESQDLRDGKWHHVTGNINNKSIKLFVDGDLRTYVTHNENLNYDERLDFLVGVHPYEDMFRFVGNMDEVRVSNVSRSNEWIRVSYENERIGSKLIKY